jgi:hypothetical protein
MDFALERLVRAMEIYLGAIIAGGICIATKPILPAAVTANM